MERGWVLASKEEHRQLTSLQQKGSKKEVKMLPTDIWDHSTVATEEETIVKQDMSNKCGRAHS